MNFDLIIGNPPYQKTLHYKIGKFVVNKTKNLLLVCPCNIIISPLAELKNGFYKRNEEFFNRLKRLEVLSLFEGNSFFNTSMVSNLGIHFFTDEKHNIHNEIINQNFCNKNFLHKILADSILDNFINHVENNDVGYKLPISLMNNGDRCYTHIISVAHLKGYKDGVSREGKRFADTKQTKACNVLSAIGDTMRGVKLNSWNEVDNLASFCKTKLMKIYYKLCTTSINACHLAVPFPDVSRSWTDEQIYEKYQLTKEDIEWVEKNYNKLKDDFVSIKID